MRIRHMAATAVATGLIGSAWWAGAQARIVRPVPPVVVSGENVGFRIEGDSNGRPIGTLVVKQDGKWIPVDLGTVRPVRPISEK